MNLIDDFFILIWGEKPSDELNEKASNLFDEILHKKVEKEKFCEASAIVLGTNPQNFDKFCELDTFEQTIGFFTQSLQAKTIHVKILQLTILSVLNKMGKSFAKRIIPHINALHEANIINDESKQKLVSLLDLVEVKKSQKVKAKKSESAKKIPKSFKESVIFFENIISEFNSINESENLKNQASSLHVKLQNQTFSIGITGVMNAGKSTMLNALLGKEVLGTSVVPETANLTIIKYDKNPHARVNFWNKNEWENIEKTAPFMPSIAEFVKQTKEGFGDDLDKLITKKGKVKDIKTAKLSSYTSAKHSNLTCNLVKSVELYEDLEFVKDGVSIVDTPGLDDPVVQREEITKDYLSDCDVMIHLMNVNQSATQKDVDFIIDSLTYGHISRLLIVITRIDTVSTDELKEVEEYTKKSIKSRLQQDNKEARFDSIISKIDFLPIAGKLALMYKIGREKEALDAGFSLEDTGILQIEEYLKDVLFGNNNDKNRLFLQSVHKEILALITYAKNGFDFEKRSLGKSSDELKEDFGKLQKKNEANLSKISTIQNQIHEAKTSLQSYFETLEHFIKGKLSSLKNITIQRICDDVSYEWRKNKKKPKSQRIKSMIETSMKDGIVDMIRDYRFEFSKRMQSEMEQISFDETNVSQMNPNVFNAKEYLEQNFGTSFLSGGYAVTHERVLNALKKVKKGEIESFSVELDEIFSFTVSSLSSSILPSLESINKNLLDGFIDLANKPANSLKQSMKEEENIIKSHINLLESDTKKATQRLGTINDKISSLTKLNTLLKENTL